MYTSVNQPNKRVEVENTLFIYGKGEGKGGCLGGKDFLFMTVSICLYLFSVVII